MRVLIVDDERDVRSVLLRALARDGHAVSTASDLTSARSAVDQGVDLVVLDLGLPDGSGLELCQALRAEDRMIVAPRASVRLPMRPTR